MERQRWRWWRRRVPSAGRNSLKQEFESQALGLTAEELLRPEGVRLQGLPGNPAQTAALTCLGFGGGVSQEQTVQEGGLGARLEPSSTLPWLSIGMDTCLFPLRHGNL